MRRDDLYLFEIVEAADHVRDFLRDIEIDAWTEDGLLRSGVLQKFTMIGEATRGLNPVVKSRHPQVPWPHVIDLPQRRGA